MMSTPLASRPSLLTFESTVQVHWEDTDAGGIVYYANYLKFFERARSDMVRRRGISQQQLIDDQVGSFVVRRVDVKYLQSARLDDLLHIQTHVEHLGAASVQLLQCAVRRGLADGNTAPKPETVVCQATVCLAWLDGKSRKPAKIPVFIRACFESETLE